MRISARERKENARQWYQRFINGYDTKIAIVVKRNESTTNPNINRTQFFSCNNYGTPIIIAESSTDGIVGCFYELLQNIKKTDNFRSYHENDFNEWLEENYGMYITYRDGFVFMLEREVEE